MKNSEKAVSNSRFHQNIRVFFSRGFMSKICFGIIIVFVVLAVLAPVLAPYPPTEQSLTEALRSLVLRTGLERTTWDGICCHVFYTVRASR